MNCHAVATLKKHIRNVNMFISHEKFGQIAWRYIPQLNSSCITFLRKMLLAPSNVGAICPSSVALAQTMAHLLPPEALYGQGLVLELGPGTGSVTSALLGAGLPPQRLLLIECMPEFCHLLQQRFPDVNTVQGDAACMQRYIPAGKRVAAIVSSLPLLSMPPEQRENVIDAMKHTLDNEACIIQFTYSLWGNTPLSRKGYHTEMKKYVLYNIPPARVERLRWSHSPS